MTKSNLEATGVSVVEKVGYDRDSLKIWEKRLRARGEGAISHILDYPTVYVIAGRRKRARRYSVYVGETNDIVRRTRQHLNRDVHVRNDFRELRISIDPQMYVMGNDYFNKSLTLDIENRLMQYITAVDSVSSVGNRRTNAQGNYYTDEYLDEAFENIWEELHKCDPILFPAASKVRDSAIFKASPFHRLNDEQESARQDVLTAVQGVEVSSEKADLIMVTGEAGSGKTVLISSLFVDLLTGQGDPGLDPSFTNRDAYLLVNHEQQLNVYEEIAKKLGIYKNDDASRPPRVLKPTTFIHRVDPTNPVDLVLVDEAHLLLTQGNQGYQGDNQLKDILQRSRLVVAVYDEKQTLETGQLWEEDTFDDVFNGATIVPLKRQMRMDAVPATVNWVRQLVDERTVAPFPVNAGVLDDKGFDLRIFDDAQEMYDALRGRDQECRAPEEGEDSPRSAVESGLSRLLATFDWPYSSKRKPDDGRQYWTVDVGNLSIPWNLQLKGSRKKPGSGSWAEQTHTLDEVGSTFTVQGLDLNYAAVILGPSIVLRDGKIVIEPEASSHKKAIQRRQLADGSKEAFAEKLLANQLNVLLTRGVHGLYIYAVDEALRKELLRSQGQGRLG